MYILFYIVNYYHDIINIYDDILLNLLILNTNGLNVVRDYSNFYLRATEKGHVAAIKWIGNLYANGTGVEQDYSKAFDYYLKAGEKDYLNGFFNIAFHFLIDFLVLHLLYLCVHIVHIQACEGGCEHVLEVFFRYYVSVLVVVVSLCQVDATRR